MFRQFNEYDFNKAEKLLGEVQKKIASMESYSIKFKAQSMTSSDMKTLEMMLEMILIGRDVVNEMALATKAISILERQKVVTTA